MILVNFLSWSANSQLIYVTHENKNKKSYCISIINLNFNDNKNLYSIDDKNFEFKNEKIKDARLYSLYKEEDVLLITGDNPKIIHLMTNEIFNFFIVSPINSIEQYTFILKETFESSSFFLLIKELYLIILIKEKKLNYISKFKYLKDNLDEKKLNSLQIKVLKWVIYNLNENMVIVDVFGINTNGEIINVQINSLKNLLLVNSTDKYLRLFKYDFDCITMDKDYTDSVNRKKWVNAHFYTFNVKNTFQDLILTALIDVNSLELIFIDIDTGNFIKRLEPFKYQCSDFICHYTNHFTIVLLSVKKIYNIFGFLVNNWSAFAPQFKYMEENIEFIEDEAFFDNFNNNLKKKQSQILPSKNSIKSIFKPDIDKSMAHSQNLFFKFTAEEEDQTASQSEKDLREVFQQFGEIMELNKK